MTVWFLDALMWISSFFLRMFWQKFGCKASITQRTVSARDPTAITLAAAGGISYTTFCGILAGVSMKNTGFAHSFFRLRDLSDLRPASDFFFVALFIDGSHGYSCFCFAWRRPTLSAHWIASGWHPVAHFF